MKKDKVLDEIRLFPDHLYLLLKNIAVHQSYLFSINNINCVLYKQFYEDRKTIDNLIILIGNEVHTQTPFAYPTLFFSNPAIF